MTLSNPLNAFTDTLILSLSFVFIESLILQILRWTILHVEKQYMREIPKCGFPVIGETTRSDIVSTARTGRTIYSARMGMTIY